MLQVSGGKDQPAGVPSYKTYKDNDEETRVRARSASKWREGDDATYEPRKPKFKINRQSTEDLETIQDITIHGMRYPKWWGDGSQEKPRQHSKSFAEVQNNNSQSMNFQNNNQGLQNQNMGVQVSNVQQQNLTAQSNTY